MPKVKPPLEMFHDRPMYEVKRFSRFKWMTDRLNEQHGAGQWGLEEVYAEMLANEAAKLAKAKDAVKKAEVVDASRMGQIAKRVRQYRLTFKDVTINDEVLLAEMAEIEIQLAELSGRKYEHVSETKAAGELRIKLVQQHQKIQNDLGIAREQREGERDVDATLREFVARSRALVTKRAIPILCPACLRAKRKINLGFIVFHFAGQTTYHWSCICPQCGAAVDIVGEVDPAMLRPAEPEQIEAPETNEQTQEPDPAA